ncbi:MAG: Beta-barrel assembly-enhancing protease [bacterium]|nr:Beta-barrel assembly-enhancing protease [bacterium]
MRNRQNLRVLGGWIVRGKLSKDGKETIMKAKIFVGAATLLCVFTSGWAQSQITKGEQLLRQGKTEAALVELRYVVAKFPKNPAAWQWLGEAYLQAAKPDSALWAGEKLVDLNEKTAEGYSVMARAYLAKKDLNAAKSTLRAGLKFNKQNADLLRWLGEALVASDSTDKAIVAFVQATKAAPHHPAAYEALGNIYRREGGTVMAMMNYEKALELDSLHADLYHKLAKMYVEERRYNDAARIYQRVIKLDTTNQAAVMELAKLFFAAKQYAKAVPLLQGYVRSAPDSLNAWIMYVDALYITRQYKEVPAVARKLLALQPNSAKTLRMLAHANFETRDYEQTIAAYQQLKRQETLAGDEFKRLGKAYLETKQDSLAANAYEEALRLGAGSAEIYGELGALYMRARNFEKAAATFEKRFLQDSMATSAYVNYALSNMALSKWELARVALYRAVELKPDYVLGHLFLARALSQMDSLARARKECETVIKLAGASGNGYKAELAEAHGLIGFAYLLEKRYADAIEPLKNSIRLKGDNPQTHLWLAQAYALSSMSEEAVAEYKIVLKLDPRNKEAKKNLALIEQ